MMPISRLFTKRISVVLSYLSASWPAGGREQQEGQDEQRADHQAGQRRRQPVELQLVGDHHGEGELEQVVVRGAEELRPEEGREAALATAGRTGWDARRSGVLIAGRCWEGSGAGPGARQPGKHRVDGDRVDVAAENRALGWSSKAMLAAVTRPPSRFMAEICSVVGW
jgi:hypothetical protein